VLKVAPVACILFLNLVFSCRENSIALISSACHEKNSHFVLKQRDAVVTRLLWEIIPSGHESLFGDQIGFYTMSLR
jgi:hypothetical protein